MGKLLKARVEDLVSVPSVSMHPTQNKQAMEQCLLAIHFCRATAKDSSRSQASVSNSRLLTSPCHTWEDCIKLVETDKLSIEYSLSSDGTGMTGEILRYLRKGNIGKIIGIGTSGSEDNVICKIGLSKVNIGEIVDLQIEKGQTAISCEKDPNVNVKIIISTTEGDLDWILLPSQHDIKNETTRVSLGLAAEVGPNPHCCYPPNDPRYNSDSNEAYLSASDNRELSWGRWEGDYLQVQQAGRFRITARITAVKPADGRPWDNYVAIRQVREGGDGKLTYICQEGSFSPNYPSCSRTVEFNSGERVKFKVGNAAFTPIAVSARLEIAKD